MSDSKQSKNSAPKFELPTDRAPTPGEVEHYIKSHPELNKPLIFPNHQKQLVAFTWLSCAALTFYLVFLHEFRQEEHCFSPIRRFTSRLKKKIFSVGEEEEDAIQKRIQELQEKIEAKKSMNANNDVNPT